MRENSLSKSVSPIGIPMPDAALAGLGRSDRAFVCVTFLPSPFGPGYTAGICGWQENYDHRWMDRWRLFPSGGRCAGVGPGLQRLLSAMAQNRGGSAAAKRRRVFE